MSEHLDELDLELEPELVAAYAAEHRVTAAAVAAAAITRDRLLVATLARAAHARIDMPARQPTRRRWMIAAALVACVAIGWAARQVTAPQVTAPQVTAPQVTAPAPAVQPAPRAGIRAARTVDAAVTADAATADAATSVDAVTAGAATSADAATSVDAAKPLDAALSSDASAAQPVHSTDSGEVLLLDQARAALRRRLLGEARQALELHARRFSRGQLREERDALLIEVALAQRRLADANELIGAYFDAYPDGSLRERVVALQRELDELIRRRR